MICRVVVPTVTAHPDSASAVPSVWPAAARLRYGNSAITMHANLPKRSDTGSQTPWSYPRFLHNNNDFLHDKIVSTS